MKNQDNTGKYAGSGNIKKMGEHGVRYDMI